MPDSIDVMVARIDERTESIVKKMDTHCGQLGDHEKRLNGLEGFRMAVYIASAVVVALIGLVIAAMGLR